MSQEAEASTKSLQSLPNDVAYAVAGRTRTLNPTGWSPSLWLSNCSPPILTTPRGPVSCIWSGVGNEAKLIKATIARYSIRCYHDSKSKVPAYLIGAPTPPPTSPRRSTTTWDCGFGHCSASCLPLLNNLFPQQPLRNTLVCSVAMITPASYCADHSLPPPFPIRWGLHLHCAFSQL